MTYRIAIVGSGIAGLSAAHALQKHPQVQVSLFEANDYFGGHTHTVDIQAQTTTGVKSYPVDTGFLVFNERTYPQLIALFEELNIPTAYSDMSFSVQAPTQNAERLEWSGTSLNSVFCQRKNLFSKPFWSMLGDLLRFNKLTTQLAQTGDSQELDVALHLFLEEHKFSAEFINWYLLPMLGCIWSCPPDQMRAFPLATMIRFCHNHGLLQITNRPKWYTVAGGAKQYVSAITQQLPNAHLNTPVQSIQRSEHKITLLSNRGPEEFDKLIIATHADQALKLLDAPSQAESGLLRAFKFKDNVAVLHRDAGVLPTKQIAWAAWNFESARTAHHPNCVPVGGDVLSTDNVCLHYYLNKLQPLPFTEPVVVSLNPIREIKHSKIAASFNYSHPVFDLSSIAAQKEMQTIQGTLNTWYAGAWLGYGFHEDGLKAGQLAARGVLDSLAIQG